MKRKFTQFIDEAGDSRLYFVGIILLFLLLLVAHVAGAQTINSPSDPNFPGLSPSCATVGKSFELTINGQTFRTDTQGSDHGLKVIISDDSNGQLIGEILTTAPTPTSFNVTIPVSPFLSQVRVLRVQVANRDKKTPNYLLPSNAVKLTVAPQTNAGAITKSPTSFCAGTQNVTYSIAPVTGAVSYNWSVPTGATIVSGQSTNLITVNFANSASTGNVAVTATNSCGTAGNPSSTPSGMNPLPALPTVQTPAEVCGSGVANLTATVGANGNTIRWYDVSTGGTSLFTGTSYSPNISTTTKFFAATYNTTTGCESASRTEVTVTVNPQPTLSSAASATVCSGTAFTYTAMSATAGTSFSWSRVAVSGISGSTAGSGTSATISETLTNSTAKPVQVTYNITMSANGCSNTEPVTVTVNPKPTLSSATSATVCSGTAFNYTAMSATAGTSFSWSRVAVSGISGSTAGSGTSATISETLTNSTANPVQVTYNITMSANGCSNTEPVTVTVYPQPILNSNLTPAAVCSGATFNYTSTSATAGATFSWSRTTVSGISGSSTGTGSSATISETLTNSTANPIDVTYVITASANGCVGPPQNVTVRVNPSPTLSSPVTASVCSGTAFTYTATSATAGTSFSWSRAAVSGVINPANNGTSASINETLTNNTASPVQVTYNVTMVANGCSNTQDVTVTVNPSPVLSSPLTASVCSGTAFTYTATSATTGTGFSWSRVSVAGITGSTAGSGTSAFINETLTNSTANPVQVTYNVTMSANGCSNTQDVKVTVNPRPVLTSTLSPADICDGATFSYTPTSATAGATFSWSRGADLDNAAMSGTGPISEVLKNSGSTFKTITYVITTTANSCTSVTQQVKVKVNPKPKLASFLTATVCSGQPFNYTPISTPSGASFSWSRAAVTGISNAASSGFGAVNETLVNNTSAPVQVTYLYTTTANGCSETETVTVTVNPQPSAEITPIGPTSFCQAGGNSVTLKAPTGSGYTYQWYSGGTLLADSTAQSIIVTEPGSYNFSVKVTNQLGCETISSPIFVKVVALDANVANITYTGSTKLCEGESLILNAVANTNYSYQWNDEKGPINGATTSTFEAKVSGTYTVTIKTLVDNQPCEKTSEPITVTVTPALFNTLSSGDTEICSGGTAPQLVGVAASGGDGQNYTYLWESSTSSSSSGFTAATGTNNGVNYDPGAPSQTTWYRRLVTSGDCEIYSEPVKVTVTPVITNNTLIITDKVICAGQAAPILTARVPTGGNGTYTYQWEASTDEGATFNAISGATAQDYSPGVLLATTIFRRRVISGACESTTPTNIQVTVTPSITNFNVTAGQIICSGSAPASLIGTPAGGSGSYTYQWERSTDGTNFSAISGATAQDYTPGSLTADTWYRRKVSSGNCSEYSNAVKITVTPPIGNNLSTSTLKSCAGEAVPELIADAATGGNGTYTYSWESSADGTSFNSISGASAQTYAPGNLTQNTWFRRKVESGACTSYSAAVKVEVTPAITNNRILSEDFSVCYDTYPGTLTGSDPEGGNGSYTYRWESSTTSATEGFSLTGYYFNRDHAPGSLKETTWYRRTVISGNCVVTSEVVKITVTPAITNHVISGTQQYCIGAVATPLTGSYQGGDNTTTPTYQWQQSTTSTGPWEDITTGGNGASFTPPTATVGRMFYRRLVSSDGCTDKVSNVLAVTVNPLPATNAVANRTHCIGTSAAGISFSSPVSGSTYSWTSTVDVGFGTSGTGNISNYVAKNTGTTAVTATVTVIATANGCPGPEMTFTITVNPLPVVAITTNLKNSYCKSEPAVSLAGSPSGGVFTINGTQVTTLDPGALAAGTYNLIYTYTDSGTGCTNTASKTVVINAVPTASFTGVTDGQVIYSGQGDITLSGSPTGGTWSWPGRTSTSGNTFSPCAVYAEAIKSAPSGATDVDVTISYTVIGTNGCQNTATRTVKLKKSKYNVIVSSSLKPFCRGDNVTHTVSVWRDATVIYPYLVNAAGDPVRADGVTPVGVNELPVANPNYPYPAGTSEVAKKMAFRFFQPIVIQGTSGVKIPDSQISAAWSKNQGGDIGNKEITFSNAGLSSLEYYAARVTVNLACGEAFNRKLSYRAYGAVLDDYAISIAVSNNPLCPGSPTTFTATLDADFDYWETANLIMYWKLRRGSNVYTVKTVVGTTPLTLTSAEIEAALAAQNVSPATLIDNDEVFIEFTSDLEAAMAASKQCKGRDVSNPIIIRVNDIIPANPTLQNPVVCIGSTVTFTAPVSPTGTAQVTYTWTVGSGANARTYTTNTNQLIITADGSFTPDVTYPVSVVVSNGCVTTQSLALGSITVNTPPSISVQPVPVRICEGTRTVFSVTAAGSGITYQWLKNGQPISGATSSTYVIESPVKVDEGTYSVQIIGTTACGNLTSQGATLTIDQPATITANLPSAGQTVCLGGTATYTVNATGTDLQFSWFKAGGVPVTNGGRFTIQSTASGSTLTITNVEAGDAGNYYVVVSNSTATACNVPLNSFEVPLVVNPLPVAKTILGGPYCPIDEPNGATISVENSESGITYSLMQGGTVLATLAGDGTTKAFPGTYKEGTYTVSATNTSTTCGNSSVGQTTVTVTDVPVVNGELQITWINNKTQWEIVALSDYADKSDLVYSWYIGAGATEPTLVTSTNTIVIDNTDPELYVKCLITSSLGRCVPDLELNSEEVVPLPVEIIYLTAEKQGSDVLLKWATAMEKDNTGFEVQVSNDGDNFRKITFVPTRNGNSSMKQLYEYKDIENGKHGTRYYRLKQLDASGTFEYFGPKVVEFGSVSDNIKVYPNPFLNEVNLSIEAEQDGEVEIVFSNAVGRQIIKTTVQVEKGLNTEQILLDMTLPRGVYFITTRMGSVTNHFKLLKQ